MNYFLPLLIQFDIFKYSRTRHNLALGLAFNSAATSKESLTSIRFLCITFSFLLLHIHFETHVAQKIGSQNGRGDVKSESSLLFLPTAFSRRLSEILKNLNLFGKA